MTDGLKAKHRAAIIATLAANHRLERAVLFGARAMGTNTITSDVDIALFGQQLTLTDQASLAAACEELPMAQSVDLVLHSAIDNPALVEHIGSYGVEWYQRGGGEDSVVSGGLGDIAEIVMGQSPPGKSCNEWGKGIPLLNGPTEFGSYHPKPVQFTTDARKVAMTGDILFCVRGSTTGRMNYADQQYAIGRGIAAIRHKTNSQLQPLIRGIVETQLSSLLQAATGSTFPNVSANQLSNLTIPKITEKQMLNIADLLKSLDNKIELNRRMNETLEAMARALFKDWFVDFGPVRAKAEGREAYLPEEVWGLFPDSFEDSELGEIPRGWGLKRLEDYLELAYGKSLPKKSRRPGSVPVYGSGGIVGSHDVALTKGPTVIVGRKGTVGSLYLAAQPVFPIDTVFYTLPHIGSMLFSYHLLACQPLRTMNTDAAVPGLNRSNVYRLQFPCPTSDLISVFDDMAGCLWKRQADALGESGALTQIRDLLVPNLISGKVTIDEIEKVAETVQ